MSPAPLKILVVGATGSIGRLVVAQALRQGHAVRALVRDLARAGSLPEQVQRVVGDLTRPETLAAAVDGIDAIVLTHGSDGGGHGACARARRPGAALDRRTFFSPPDSSLRRLH
ncbi:NAD(P)H-binding protein (plasmid) [Ralstonia syzygii]|uniref:NAD(P)H-binding protein n=1 Tax=Ralstonia syzygii TaxID=28097 RepID=A0ABX7ZKZ7_9RALS|nr:NAD(P)H-binding protein [Ralstonia syzygii]QUP56041.1 NAD(P)H-binding protein [Ralstonia syzygii]